MSPFMELFNAAEPAECYRRSESIVPQQALALSNSRMALDAARHIARSLSECAGTGGSQDETFTRMAYEHLLTRAPRAEELAACIAFLETQRALYVGAELPAAPAGALAAATDPVQRARESLVHALLNQNAFLTVR